MSDATPSLSRRWRPPGRHSTQGSTTANLSGSIDELLRDAIARKRLIRFTYSGRTRIAEPHDYGIMNATRKLLVHQHYASGSSAQDRKPERGWRLLEVSKIEECSVLDQTFAGSRGESSQRHMVWDELFVRVE